MYLLQISIKNTWTNSIVLMIILENIRTHFPILSQIINGKPLIYLDNAATMQKPQCVIDTINELYTQCNANIHRGVHTMAEQCTLRYEESRKKIQAYINAEHLHEVIFTAGTTASINLVAFSFGERYIQDGDEIIISELEHHSNIVAWQMLCERKGAILKIIPFLINGELDLEQFTKLLSDKTKLVAVAHVSNVLGTVNDVERISQMAHSAGAYVLIDGAQAVPHGSLDVQKIGCDFYAFSGHKMYAPTGVGVLYAKESLLHEMPPYQGGGDMVKMVNFSKTTYADLPYKFEAGTANYIGAIGLGTAIDFIESLVHNELRDKENELLRYANEQLSSIKGLRIYGTAASKSPIVSFNLDGIHHLDVGQILDKMGIAVRTGTLCAEPIMQRFKTTGMVRASFAFYNTLQEIDALKMGLEKVRSMF
ncbi:MAG: aminotransferase class V-fold PLP-dependent enzyme [Bacteroidales bacterium]